MFGISPYSYRYIFDCLFVFPILWIFISKSGQTGNRYLLSKQSHVPTTLLTIFLIIFVGFRPISRTFCDMIGYHMKYMEPIYTNIGIDWHTEWLWIWIMETCRSLGVPATWWFAVIEFFYLGCILLACKKLISENIYVPMLFFLSSFTFFAYGVNTIRSGMACSIVILAIAFISDGKRNYWIAVLLLLAAFGIHRTTIIPIIAIIVSLIFIKKTIHAIYIWLGSVVLSLIAGNSMMSLFAGMQFDDRFELYARANSVTAQQFSHSGFRWDFLLYSFIPIFVSWYATKIKRINDKTFNLIANIYILANAVWVICIRANYSDRFAYLSWFLYPMVFAYAFVRLPLFRNQDRLMSLVLLCYAGFTLFMSLVLGK